MRHFFHTTMLGAVGVALMLAGVGQLAAQEKKTLVFVPNAVADFWKAAEAGVRKAQAELPDFTLQFRYVELSSVAAQNRLLDDLTASGAAGIVVSAIDPATQTEALNRVAASAVLMTTDSDAPASNRVAYIGSSNVEAGKQVGQVLLDALPDGGRCIAYVGLPGADNARERLEGISEVIKGSAVELVDVRADDVDMSRARRNVEDTLTAQPDVNCMVGVYSYNIPQIYQALKDSGQLGNITVTGFDDDPITLGGVKEGSIVATVVQQPYEWGYQSMKMLAAIVDGNRSGVPEDGLIIVPTRIITQDNVDAYGEELRNMLNSLQ